MNEPMKLQQEIETLTLRFKALAELLDAAAARLRDPGEPPSQDLEDQIAEIRKSFERTMESIRSMLDRQGGDRKIKHPTLKDCRQAVKEIERKQNKQLLDDLRSLLDIVLKLRHCDSLDFQPLADCQAEAKRLKQLIAQDRGRFDPNAEPNIIGYRNLVDMIQSPESITDEKWLEMEASVESAFGRPFRVALSRKKFVISSSSAEKNKNPSKSQDKVGTPPDEFSTPSFGVDSEKRFSAETPIAGTDSKDEAADESQDRNIATNDDSGDQIQTIEVEKVPCSAEGEKEQFICAETMEEIDNPDQILNIPGAVAEELSPISKSESLPVQEASTPEPSRESSEFTLEEEETPSEISEQSRGKLTDEPVDSGVCATELAKSLISQLPNASKSSFCELIWKLTLEGHLELAFHLANAYEKSYPDSPIEPPSFLVKAVIIGKRVGFPAGELSEAIQTHFSNHFFTEKFQRKGFSASARLMWAAAAIRAALFAPHTGAGQILAIVRPDFGNEHHLDALCMGIHELSSSGQPFTPIDLSRSMDYGSWEVLNQQICRQAAEWFHDAAKWTIKFAAATAVWRKWVGSGGVIHNLVKPIFDPALRQPDEMEELLNEYVDAPSVEKEIVRTERSLGRTRDKKIEGAALAKLKEWFWEARQISQRWIDHQKLKPGGKPDYHQQRVNSLHKLLDVHCQGALQELSRLTQPEKSLPIRSGATCLLTVMTELEQLFNAAEFNPIQEPSLRQLINAELLKVPALQLNDQWDVVDETHPPLLQVLLSYVAKENWDWSAAFEAQCLKGNLHNAEWIIGHLEMVGEAPEKLAVLKNRLKEDISIWQKRLNQQIREMQLLVGRAVARGGIDEGCMNDLQSRLQLTESVIGQSLNFEQVVKELASIELSIHQSQRSRIEEIQRRLSQLKLDESDPRMVKIQQVLEEGEIIIAQEYLDRFASNQPMSDLELAARDVFEDFFIRSFHKLDQYLESRKQPEIIRELKSRSPGYPVPLGPISGKQAEQACEMLNSWFELKRKAHAPAPEMIRAVLRHIGFAIPKVIESQPGKLDGIWLTVETDPIQDRSRCPLPVFGSEAKGRYRIFCVWDRPNEEDLLDAVASRHQPHPVIVFHFGRLTLQRRRDLARFCRIRRKTFIVLDDILLLFLCGERGSRLPVFFQCALPFTFNEPFTATASMISPEMFYGRNREIEYLADAKGSAFMYGGRQLGKTALLRHVERNNHNPATGRIALWLDLKTYGIGFHRSIEDIWSLIHNELGKHIDPVRKLPPNTNPQKIIETISIWLREESSRRILLLLDEADQFLQSDGTEYFKGVNFVQCSRLRGLMNSTDGRFKAVLAGLHNVQRATKDANNALAHFATGLGGEICIGPLLANGEAAEARALIEYPLACLGYRFESEDLIYRILSQTNYYPSLIQLYCSKLLQHLNESHVLNTFDQRSSPPYLISARHVDDAYQSKELREGIRSRFDLTLQLDDRYRLIAYCFALFAEGEEVTGVDAGRSAVWAWDEAAAWWPEGFKNQRTLDSFKVILDEMVGLGILRTVGGAQDRYSLRNPNIVALLGNRQELENRLESFSKIEPPPAYEPSTFRSALQTEDALRRFVRNPLTAEQESLLRQFSNGVSVIFGSRAAGLDDLEEFLLERFGKDFFIKYNGASSIEGLETRLDALAKRHHDGLTLVLIPSRCEWGYPWIETAHERCRRLTSKSSHVRIALVADPSRSWSLLSAKPDLFRRIGLPDVNFIFLHPWQDAALRQCLEDCNFPANHAQVREEIRDRLGLWPVLLYEWYARCGGEPEQWKAELDKIAAEFEDPVRNFHWLGAFGLGADPSKDRFFQDFGFVGPAAIDELVGLIEGYSADDMEILMAWAESMSIVARTSQGKMQLDPVVNALLKSRSNAL